LGSRRAISRFGCGDAAPGPYAILTRRVVRLSRFLTPPGAFPDHRVASDRIPGRLQHGRSPNAMLDLVFVAAGLAFFTLAAGYAALCASL
jgi:hypothetical protein